jgi:hypothetical protein
VSGDEGVELPRIERPSLPEPVDPATGDRDRDRQRERRRRKKKKSEDPDSPPDDDKGRRVDIRA